MDHHTVEMCNAVKHVSILYNDEEDNPALVSKVIYTVVMATLTQKMLYLFISFKQDNTNPHSAYMIV